MDFSQLPKMSNTPKSPASPEETRSSQPERVVYVPAEGGMGFGFASVWISLILGLILMMMGANFGRWATAKLAGKPFNTGVEWSAAAGEKAGQMVEYFELQGGTAWSETGLFLMGVALLLDAVLMFLYYRSGRPATAIIWLAVLFTSVAMALNLFVAVRLFSFGMMPLMTMGALLVGGMMLFDHLPMLRSTARPAAR